MKKEKRFILSMSEDDHKRIKARSAHMSISMNQYVMEAVATRFLTEIKLGWPEDLKPFKQE